jgi:hypothetical protein
VAGNLGRNPTPPSTYIPKLEEYLRPWEGPLVNPRGPRPVASPTPYLPPATGVIDRATKVPDWGMLANGPDPANPSYAPDGLGDCTIAEVCHCFMGMCVYAGNPGPVFTPQAAITAYSACGGYVAGEPGTDNGCDMGTVMAYAKSTGIPDSTGKVHQLVGYASFNPRNRALCAQVLDTFGCAYLGGLLQQAQQDQFVQGVPWQWEATSQIDGGHAYGYAYRGIGGVGVHGCTTWGFLQHATGHFLWNSLDPAQGGEAYMLVSRDWLDANGTTVQGLDLQQLLTDMQEVG